MRTSPAKTIPVKNTCNIPVTESVCHLGGWKISSYMTHLRSSAHQKTEQRPIDASETGSTDTGSTETGSTSGNSDNAVDEKAEEEPQPKTQRIINRVFSPSASTSSQSTST